MRFEQFLRKNKNLQYIDTSTFLLDENPRYLRRQVSGWIRKGYLVPIKRGMHVFGEPYATQRISQKEIGNLLVVPSYISLESALEFHGLIPESVSVVTSVTTKKTAVFTNAFGRFEFCSVKKELFFGFSAERTKKERILIAYPEKAVLDYFYLRGEKGSHGEEYFDSLRFQNLEILNTRRFETYAHVFNMRVRQLARQFMRYRKKQTGN